MGKRSLQTERQVEVKTEIIPSLEIDLNSEFQWPLTDSPEGDSMPAWDGCWRTCVNPHLQEETEF